MHKPVRTFMGGLHRIAAGTYVIAKVPKLEEIAMQA